MDKRCRTCKKPIKKDDKFNVAFNPLNTLLTSVPKELWNPDYYYHDKCRLKSRSKGRAA
jgi:hypothetical protein